MTFFKITVATAIVIIAALVFRLSPPPPVHVLQGSGRYVGLPVAHNVLFNPRVRLLVLKHCPDDVANTDARQALQAADLAASKGLTIKKIGNYHVDQDGRTGGIVWGRKVYLDDLNGFKQFLKEQMQVDAVPGDTFVVYTLGHGSKQGTVTVLGKRTHIVQAIAEAAAECEQETLWWQLACYAGAGLPEISSLTETQQEFFSMLASSGPHTLSYFTTQGAQMRKVFIALAENSSHINPDRDDIVTAGELAGFLDKAVQRGRGNLLFARSDDEPIFGWWDWANRLPIHDFKNRREFDGDYVPVPSPTSHEAGQHSGG